MRSSLPSTGGRLSGASTVNMRSLSSALERYFSARSSSSGPRRTFSSLSESCPLCRRLSSIRSLIRRLRRMVSRIIML